MRVKIIRCVTSDKYPTTEIRGRAESKAFHSIPKVGHYFFDAGWENENESNPFLDEEKPKLI